MTSIAARLALLLAGRAAPYVLGFVLAVSLSGWLSFGVALFLASDTQDDLARCNESAIRFDERLKLANKSAEKAEAKALAAESRVPTTITAPPVIKWKTRTVPAECQPTETERENARRDNEWAESLFR